MVKAEYINGIRAGMLRMGKHVNQMCLGHGTQTMCIMPTPHFSLFPFYVLAHVLNLNGSDLNRGSCCAQLLLGGVGKYGLKTRNPGSATNQLCDAGKVPLLPCDSYPLGNAKIPSSLQIYLVPTLQVWGSRLLSGI